MNISFNPAVTGAFVMEGMRDLERSDGITYESLLDVWGRGCLELVIYATAFVPYMHEVAEKAHAIRNELPGVWEYEVPSIFGIWFARRVYEHPEKGLPSDEECKAEIDRLNAEFFAG